MAQLTLATPIFALYETTIANMTVEQSTNTRYWAAAITFAGIGYLDAKVRDFVRKKLYITDETDEGKQRKIDKRTKMVFNTARASLVYLLGLEGRDPTKFLRGVGLGVMYGKLFGAKSGYMMDLYRELSGIKESKRISEKIRRMNSYAKKALMVGITVASLATTMGIYKTAPHIKEYFVDKFEQYFELSK